MRPRCGCGSKNCIVAWTDGKDWFRSVKWFQSAVNASGVFTTMVVKSHGYISMGSPAVAYVGGTYPWAISITQDSNTTYSWRKLAPDTSSFQDQRSFSDSSQPLVPTLGSRLYGGTTPLGISIVGHP